MTLTTEPRDRFLALSVQPDWLTAPLDGELVLEALTNALPEFSAGALAFTGCEVKRLVLDGNSGRWVGTYQITVGGTAEEPARAMDLLGSLTPPGRIASGPTTGSAAVGFGEPGWSCWLPALGLELQASPAPPGPATDLVHPADALEIATEVLRADPAVDPGFVVRSCATRLLGYKPGNRTVARYDLGLKTAGGTTRSDSMVVKTYRSDKGSKAFVGMVELWAALHGEDAVEVARPLAYLPDRRLLAQTVLAGDRTLEEALGFALLDGSDQAMRDATAAVEGAARGLAALHRSGVDAGKTTVLADRVGQARKLLARITAAVAPMNPCAPLEPVLTRIETEALVKPTDAAVPTHGAFAPEQVLLSSDVVGLVDFDDFCLAEPGMDVGMFLAALADLALSVGPPDVLASTQASFARLDTAAGLGDAFVAEYARHSDVSPARASLWHTVELAVCAARTWSKVKRSGPTKDLRILEHHLARLGW